MPVGDYTLPPTEEFKHKAEDGIHDDAFAWLILQKAVMNDYYFDAPDTEWILSDLDGFMHKIYFCWQEAMKKMHEQMKGGFHE